MTAPWLTLRSGTEERRITLDRSVIRLGGPGSDVQIPDVTVGQLHVWTAPPKAIRVGGGPDLFVGGKRVEEALLEPGVSAVWGPVELSIGGVAAVLEELPAEPPPGRPSATPGRSGGAAAAAAALASAKGGLGPNAQRVYDRLRAGLLVELDLATKDVTKRWQASVVKGEWDADACAREVLDYVDVAQEDPRLLERAGRLQRDLVMASFQRGMRKAVRGARGAARQGSAFLIANLVALGAYSLILVAIAVLLRVRWDWSFDQLIDRAMSAFS
ncbi:MAG: hypothetical protein R3F49_19580 [Planctomycetota bacterium]